MGQTVGNMRVSPYLARGSIYCTSYSRSTHHVAAGLVDGTNRWLWSLEWAGCVLICLLISSLRHTRWCCCKLTLPCRRKKVVGIGSLSVSLTMLNISYIRVPVDVQSQRVNSRILRHARHVRSQGTRLLLKGVEETGALPQGT